MEAQFRRMFEKALKKRGVTGETLLQLLETRLDNVVFRIGFATTRPAARQMVTHGHIRVNGRKVSSPSFNVKPGDVIEVRETPRHASWPQRVWSRRKCDLCQVGLILRGTHSRDKCSHSFTG